MKLHSGHDLVPVEGEEKKKQAKDFEAYSTGLVRLTPGRWLFPARYEEVADKVYDFKFRSSDVVIMTYPKCGTTWTQEIIWTMRNSPNLDNPNADIHVMIRAPFIESQMLMPKPKDGSNEPRKDVVEAFKRLCPGKAPPVNTVCLAEAIPDPRTIKTHLPFSLMSPSMLDTAKVVYVARNPKDVIVSYHHHSRLLKAHGYVGSFDDFIQYFLDDDLMYGPYWLNLKEAWERRDHPNLHFIFFEDMKANPMEEFKKLDSFLGTNLTNAQLEGIIKHTSFSDMKARSDAAMEKKAVPIEAFNQEVLKKDGGFFRKGQSGDWKGKLTPEMEAKVDSWIKKNMDSFGINFKYGV